MYVCMHACIHSSVCMCVYVCIYYYIYMATNYAEDFELCPVGDIKKLKKIK